MKWISVKDKLPKKEGRYFVNIYEDDDFGNFQLEASFFDGDFHSNGMIPIAELVTHWMELPKPPQEL